MPKELTWRERLENNVGHAVIATAINVMPLSVLKEIEIFLREEMQENTAVSTHGRHQLLDEYAHVRSEIEHRLTMKGETP